MRVLISEFICGGGYPEPDLSMSLAREGCAMLRALVEDFQRIPSVEVSTTWDSRLGTPPLTCSQVVSVDSPMKEWQKFGELCSQVDAIFVIAPEFDGILADRVRWLEEHSLPHRGCSAAAIRLCADKSLLAGHLTANGISTIPTFPCSDAGFAAVRAVTAGTNESSPIVVKPRDGAGSQGIQLLESDSDWSAWLAAKTSVGNRFVLQPWIMGDPVSVGVLISSTESHSTTWEAFPVATQHLSQDGRFQYLGGTVPAKLDDAVAAAVRATAVAACQTIPGLQGYVGLDLLIDRERPDSPIVVEINPRLTTSYLGYSELSVDNIAARMLPACQSPSPLTWRPKRVRFEPIGVLPLLPSQNSQAGAS